MYVLQESYAEEVRAKMGESEPDREAWKKLCINFLKGSTTGMDFVRIKENCKHWVISFHKYSKVVEGIKIEYLQIQI